MFPSIKYRGDPGSGAEFLTFHRDMMREYKWIIAQYPAAGLQYEPWPTIPDDVRQVINDNTPNEVDTGLARIPQLLASGALDELGSWIEPDPRGRLDLGSGLHDDTHGAVAALEQGTVPAAAGMGSPSTAHRNIIFYRLHGWIDERYADWQRAHGQQPDLSSMQPMDMHGGGHAHFNLSAPLEPPTVQDAARIIDQLIAFPRMKIGKP
jgi:hypothetical protein